MQPLPGFILQYIQDINISRYSPAFLRLTPAGILVDYGGEIERFGIINPSLNMPAGEIAGYLEGLFPLKTRDIILPCVETKPGVFADIHLLGENKEVTWVLFLDKTGDEKKLRSLLQQSNEEQLLRETCGGLPSALVTSAILRRLNIVIFEELAVNRFAVIGTLPSWFHEHFNKCIVFDKEGYINPAICFPFLEFFLVNEAKKAWEQNNSAIVTSDIWIENDPRGNEYYFDAIAVSINRKKLLLVQRIDPETSRNFFHIQKGREKSLAYEKAVKAEKMLRSFLASISHELRTPMNAILGISKMLHKYYSENLTGKQLEGLQLIYESGERLLNLINNLLDLSKIEAGKMQITPGPVKTDDLITEVEKLIPPLIKHKDIEFSIKKGSPVPHLIMTDKEKIHQVLLNLLGNAVKFTRQGKILLKVFTRQDKLYFEVQDTGIGIAEEHLPYIFDTFTQVNGSSSREYGGTGLGLALCKKLAALLKGDIKARSKLGRGSVFTFYIPLETVKEEVNAGPGPVIKQE